MISNRVWDDGVERSMNEKEIVLDVVEIVAQTAVSVIPVGGALITAIYDTVKGNALATEKI